MSNLVFVIIVILAPLLFASACCKKFNGGKTLAETIDERGKIESKAEPEPETDDTEPDIYSQKRALLEYLMFLDDMIETEPNPEKTIRYLDKKQKVLKDLAKLNK